MPSAASPGRAPSLVRVLIGLGLDYLRWTQFVPMIMAWAFLLLMVGAMLLVNFQERSFGLIESGFGPYEHIAGPIAPEGAPPEGNESRALAFTEAGLKPLVLRAWGLLALAGWLLGMARRLLFGPRPRRSLRHKLVVTAIAGLACTGLFLFAYFFGSESFEDPFVHWLLLFIGIPFGVWCVSVWSLTISAGIDWIHDRLGDQPAPRETAAAASKA